ncbi:MAG: hypothetical protein AAFR69_06940 [Pseudomonadota bacterium]
MSDRKGGPHYAPELDPNNPKSPKGFGGKWTMRYLFALVLNTVSLVTSLQFGPDWLTITLIVIEVLLLSPFVGFGAFN